MSLVEPPNNFANFLVHFGWVGRYGGFLHLTGFLGFVLFPCRNNGWEGWISVWLFKVIARRLRMRRQGFWKGWLKRFVKS